MTVLDMVVKKDRLDVTLQSFSSVADRMADVDKVIEVAAKERQHKVLVTLYGQGNVTGIEEMFQIAAHIQDHDWVLRRKGFHLVIAVVVVNSNARKYAMRERVATEFKLPIRLFDDMGYALEWLANTDDLSDVIAHYQPIVKIGNGQIVGYEALARKLVDGIPQLPYEWLSALFANPRGSLKLSRHMLEQICDAFPLIDEDCYISINFEPDDMFEGALVGVGNSRIFKRYAHRVVVEVAERGKIPLDAVKAMGMAKTLGTRIALDDFGAGMDRISAIIDMKPSMIKLDLNLIQRIQEKRVASLIRMFTAFCASEGISILAEGIETEELAEQCTELGIGLGQGNYFGEPSPIVCEI